MRPRDDQPGVFDDSTDDTQSLWGIYAGRRLGADRTRGIDAYYLGYQNDAAAFDQGTGSERRHTIGIRYSGSNGAWDRNIEPMVQFGRFGHGDIRAWTIATETGFTWTERRWRPRVMLSANTASGDRDAADADLQTFNPLFPRGNYFSEDATLGPQNFFNAHLFLTVHPTRRWSLTGDSDLFWRQSTRDAEYGPSGSILPPSGDSESRFVAIAFSLNSEWAVSEGFGVTAIYAHPRPEDFIQETGPAEPLRFLELTGRYRF